jgi:hypothetical protein
VIFHLAEQCLPPNELALPSVSKRQVGAPEAVQVVSEAAFRGQDLWQEAAQELKGLLGTGVGIAVGGDCDVASRCRTEGFLLALAAQLYHPWHPQS